MTHTPETLPELVDQLHKEIEGKNIALAKRLEWIRKVEAINADLLAALKAVEWVCDAGLWYCPCCKQQRTKGHKTDCQLAAALAKAKGE